MKRRFFVKGDQDDSIFKQNKMSFTARLTSLILQQYKIGFKVELKKINVIVVPNGVTSTDERFFLVFRNANNASNKYGK